MALTFPKYWRKSVGLMDDLNGASAGIASGDINAPAIIATIAWNKEWNAWAWEIVKTEAPLETFAEVEGSTVEEAIADLTNDPASEDWILDVSEGRGNGNGSAVSVIDNGSLDEFGPEQLEQAIAWLKAKVEQEVK